MSNSSQPRHAGLLIACALWALASCAPSGEKLLARAEQQLAAGEYRAAMIDLRNYLSKNPGDAHARAMLSLALLKLGSANDAQAELAKAKAAGAVPADTLVVDCGLMVARNEHQKVLDECVLPAGTDEHFSDIAIARGDAFLGLQRYEEARGSFEAAQKAQPESLDALGGLAAAAFGAGGPGAAHAGDIEAARTVMAGAPDSLQRKPGYWLTLGSLERQAGAYEQAEVAFQKAVASADDDASAAESLSALYNLTAMQLQLGKQDEAKATCDRLLKAAPRSQRILTLCGKVSATGGNLAEARDLLQEAVAIKSGSIADELEARMWLGAVNIKLGNLGQAEMHLQNVVTRDPANARAQVLLSEVQSRLRTPEVALETLKPALSQPKADASLLAQASQLALHSGDRAQALSYLEQASESFKDLSAEKQLQVASGYLAAGEFDRAIELLESMPPGAEDSLQRESVLITALLSQHKFTEAQARADALAAPTDASAAARSVAAGTYAVAGQRDRARIEYEKVLAGNPGDVTTMLSLARLDLLDRKTAAAEKRLQAVLKADPKNLSAQLYLAEVGRQHNDPDATAEWMQRVATDHADSPRALLLVAQYHLANRNYGQARQVVAEVIKLDPKSAPAYTVRGLAEQAAGEPKLAVASLQEAVRNAPKSVGYRLNLGRALVMQNDLDGALKAFESALQLDGRNLQALYLAATTALRSDKVELASGYVARLREAAPDSTAAMRIEGDLAMAQKRYRDAAGYYDKALAGSGDTILVAARYRAGKLAGETRPEKVILDWLAKRPDDLTARILLAEHYQQAGDLTRARQEYEEAVKRSPANAVALNNLAALLQVQGDPAALDLARRAHDAAPDNAAIQDTYGWLLVEQGEVDRGLELLRPAARSAPGSPEIQYHLGAALARKGLKDEARGVLEQVSKSDAPRATKDAAQRELARL